MENDHGPFENPECIKRIRVHGFSYSCNGQYLPLSGMTEGDPELCDKCYDCPLRIRGFTVI